MPHASATARIALIGDLHSAWDYPDVDYFNRSDYELLLVAGDLGASQARDGLRIARSMARLARRALVMPGNNDVDDYARIAAELTYRQGQADLLEDLLPEPGEPDARPRTCGYSLHPLCIGGFEFTIIAARPFAMGGNELSFPDALEHGFGVRSMAESVERLCALVDRAPTEHVVFLAHNGPSGLGEARDSPWGRDFHPEAGDWGDSDLREAIDHAAARKRQTLAVVAGHMHSPLRGSGERRWQLQVGGTLYVNCARVPRVFDAEVGKVRHHIALELGRHGARAEAVLIRDERTSMV